MEGTHPRPAGPDSTTMALLEVGAGGKSGMGWSYAGLPTAALISSPFVKLAVARAAMAIDFC